MGPLMTERAVIRPRRLPDWTARLAKLVENRRHVPFAWGTNDCGTFAADNVEACRGLRVPLEAFDYRHERGALRFIVSHGRRDLEGIVTAALGAPEAGVNFADRGDVGLVETANGPTVAVVLVSMLAAPGEKGLVFWPRRGLLKVWKV